MAATKNSHGPYHSRGFGSDLEHDPCPQKTTVYNYPEVDRILNMGLHKEYVRVLFKIIFYLL